MIVRPPSERLLGAEIGNVRYWHWADISISARNLGRASLFIDVAKKTLKSFE